LILFDVAHLPKFLLHKPKKDSIKTTAAENNFGGFFSDRVGKVLNSEAPFKKVLCKRA
jgi:hypothetical protein